MNCRETYKFDLWGIKGTFEVNSGYVVKADSPLEHLIGQSVETAFDYLQQGLGTYERVKQQVQHAFIVDIGDVCDALELARSRGKKEGDSYEEELFEILERKQKKVQYLGNSGDLDLLQANLRELGLGITKKKILDLRSKKNEKKDSDDSQTN